MSKRRSVGAFVPQDKWFHEAKKQGYRARSAFKLAELDSQFGLVRPGMDVLDVGAAPGSFLQYMSRKLKGTGRLVGVDLKPIEKLEGVKLLVGDVLAPGFLDQIASVGVRQFDLVTSDIAPNTSGLPDVDQYASVELNLKIMEAADAFLKRGGNLVLKVFIGADVGDLLGPLKKRYETVRRAKPEAVRDRSVEEYFVCLGKKT